MPTIDEIAKAAARRCVEHFRDSCASACGIPERETLELRDIIYKETLALLESSREPPAALVAAVAAAEATPAPEITAGAVVRLRSGGPLMTVGDAPRPMLALGVGVGGPVAACFWHNDEQHAASGLFPAASLVPARHGEPALVEAALELWGPVAILDGNDHDWAHPFDYYQSPAGTRRIVRFGKALAAVDGKARSFAPKER